MSLRSWTYSLRMAMGSMTRGGLMSLASIGTVAVSLLVLAVILLLAVNLEFLAEYAEKQVEIKAYLCSARDPNPACGGRELTAAQKQQIVGQAKALPGVREAALISREEALRRMKDEFKEHRDILEGLDEDNPLRDAVEVKATEPQMVPQVAAAMKGIAGIADVDYGKDTVEKLLKVTQAIRIGGLGLVILLLVATVLTISNTIRLAVYARRREISIMKLVGATDWFIRRPFMVEGIMLGGFGAALAMLATSSGYSWIVTFLYENVPFLPVVPPDDVISNMTVGLLLLGCTLGAIGSVVSIRRFLKI
jgi:cell division transport system permease protein